MLGKFPVSVKAAMLLISVLVFYPVTAQDINGQWKGNVSDQFDISVQLHSTQQVLTAKVSSQIGETVFENGVVRGDSLIFSDLSFNGLTLSSLKGKVKDDTIRFVVSFQGQDMKGILVRAKK